jgi:hypothetical protein
MTVEVSQSMRISQSVWCVFSGDGQYCRIASKAVRIVTDMFTFTQKSVNYFIVYNDVGLHPLRCCTMYDRRVKHNAERIDSTARHK